MKKIFVFIIFAVSVVFSQYVTVLSPNGGESWVQGTSQIITWDYNIAEDERVKINLYTDLIFTDEIATTSCTGSYNWEIAADLTPSDLYRIEIVSINESTVKDTSDNNFSIFASLGIPTLSTPENNSILGNNRPTFEWSEITNADQYIIDISDNVDFTNSVKDTISIATFTPDSIMQQGTYWWKVHALNSLGSGEDSDVWSFTIMAPPPPMLLSPTNGSRIEGLFVGFVWNKVDTADEYIIRITDLLGNYTETNVSDTTFSVAKGYGKYWWKVRSVNGAGPGEWSWQPSYTGLAFKYHDSGLPGVSGGSTDWGDYNNDGYLDVLLTGHTGSAVISRIYRNNGDGSFTDINAGLLGVSNICESKWGDFDNDGYLDILLTGYSSSYAETTKIYRNNGDGSFTDTNIDLPGVWWSSVACGDFDNDGWLDIMLTGSSREFDNISRIYRNNGDGSFSDINAGLVGIGGGSVALGDYDNDGWLDILLTGGSGLSWDGTSKIYHNNGDGSFTDINANLPGVRYSSVSWGDYDNDGDLDFLLVGEVNYPTNVSMIFRNDGDNTFTNIGSVTGVNHSSADWGDFDNDGYLDILISGNTGGVYISKVYRNNGNGLFIDIMDSFYGLIQGSADWGDFDNDGKLDFIITGRTIGSNRITRIHRNITSGSNTSPTAPSNLSSITDEDKVTLSWDRSTDNETPQNGLAYNIYIGSTPLGSDILDPMSDLSNGFRKIVSLGNCDEANFKTIKYLASGTYYWAVQSVDNGFMGSEFSVENSFNIVASLPTVPIAVEATDIDYDSFIANWELTGDKGYYIDVATNEDFTKFLNGYENRNAFNSNYIEVTNVLPDSIYYYRVRTYNADGIVSENSNAITVYGMHDPFEEIDFSLPTAGSVSWGDYNNDGWLDLLYNYQIYTNNGNETFLLANVGLPDEGVGQFGDYNNDGWLDILISSRNLGLKIYKNNGDGTFSDANITLPSYHSDHKWGDFDNDGLLDVFMTDNVDYVEYCFIYKNNGDGTFTEYDIGIDIYDEGPNDKSYISRASIADYDNNGTLDVLLQLTVYHYNDSGDFQSLERLNKLYDNNGDLTFTENPNAGFQDIGNGALSWGDYNNDGYLDLLLSGQAGNGSSDTAIYRNNQDGTFTKLSSYLKNLYNRGGAWIDHDNDGLLDFIITGWSMQAPEPYFIETIIYRNNGDDTFSSVEHNLPDFRSSNIAWGDFNNDLKNDFVISGQKYGYDDYQTVIFKNNNHCVPNNTKPIPPVNLNAVVVSSDKDWDELELSWDNGSDIETPQDALTYNIYIGTSPSVADILSPSSDMDTGYRRVAISGNKGSRNTAIIHGLKSGIYYWSVQTVDQCFIGSEFAMEGTFTSIEMDNNIPTITALMQNYPNPFNPSTAISFSIANDDIVKLNIYNANGQMIEQLINNQMVKGHHTINFNAENLNSGIYFYTLEANGMKLKSKMLLIK